MNERGKKKMRREEERRRYEEKRIEEDTKRRGNTNNSKKESKKEKKREKKNERGICMYLCINGYWNGRFPSGKIINFYKMFSHWPFECLITPPPPSYF